MRIESQTLKIGVTGAGHMGSGIAQKIAQEGIEETVMAGGGYCLWTGCAAGDCGAALILKII